MSEGDLAVTVSRDGRRFELTTAGASYRLEVQGDGRVQHIGFVPRSHAALLDVARLSPPVAPEAEVGVDGEPTEMHRGPRWIGSGASHRARYREHLIESTASGLRLRLSALDEQTALVITNEYVLQHGSSCIERRVRVQNEGNAEQLLDHLASAALHHLPYQPIPNLGELYLHTIGGGWCWEGGLRSTSLSELGLGPTFSMGAHRLETTGSWPTKHVLPLLMIEDRSTSLWWAVQVEHSASWRFEVGAEDGRAYLHAGLGSWIGAHWRKALAPGEQYWSPTVTLATVAGDHDDLANALHTHRSLDQQRRRAVPGAGDANLPVVYNEFFASMGNPTRENVLERLSAITGTGVDVFIIDGGWQAPEGSNEHCWATVGHWHADPSRFPDGLTPVAAAIREAGMVPGIWVEIECAGKESGLPERHPDWFMRRDDKLVQDFGRYFLDFGNAEAWTWARAVFERLYTDGFRYFKIDYNVDCSLGTDRGGSPGEGLVQHVHGLYSLFDDLHATHPDVIVENCASGGNRLEDGLSRHTDLCSISDHGVWEGAFHTYPALSYGLSFAIHPSQAGTWVSLEGSLSLQEMAFRFAAPLLGRIHITGQVETLDDEQLALVSRAVAFSKRWVQTVATARTYHHRAPGRLEDTSGWLAYEVAGANGTDLVGVWRRDDPGTGIELRLRGVDADVTYELEWFPSGLLERRSGTELRTGFHVELAAPFTAAVVGLRPASGLSHHTASPGTVQLMHEPTS